MSTTSYSAARFDRTLTEQCRTSRARQESARAPWPAFATVCFFVSLYDGLAAYRQYEHLKSSGVTHDAALRTALLGRPTLPKE